MSCVYLATCEELPRGDEDEDAPLLTAACARAGLDARWAVWDDPAVDWSAADLVVVRTTWDYTERRDEFLSWGRQVADVAALANSPTVLAWNSDKTYLRDLAADGVPVVPTTWAAPGDEVDLPGGTDFVVKPAVGAGSMGAGRFAADDPHALDAARRHVAALHALGRTAMIQPYLHDVDEFGETALVYLDGRYSHAIAKAPMLPAPVVHGLSREPLRSLFVSERITSRRPSAAEHELADRVLAAVPGSADLLYARVDLLPSPAGPVLIELELTEPSLFLRHHDGAADRFAQAIAGRVTSPARPAGPSA